LKNSVFLDYSSTFGRTISVLGLISASETFFDVFLYCLFYDLTLFIDFSENRSMITPNSPKLSRTDLAVELLSLKNLAAL